MLISEVAFHVSLIHSIKYFPAFSWNNSHHGLLYIQFLMVMNSSRFVLHSTYILSDRQIGLATHKEDSKTRHEMWKCHLTFHWSLWRRPLNSREKLFVLKCRCWAEEMTGSWHSAFSAHKVTPAVFDSDFTNSI